MNWDAIGAIGQVLGSLAVLITLGYLAVQVRQAKQETQRSVRQNRSDAVRNMQSDHAQSEWLNRALVKAHRAYGEGQSPFAAELVERGGLTPEEARAVDSFHMAWWMFNAQQIAHLSELADSERIEFVNILQQVHRSGMVQRFYELNRSRLNPDAVRYIDNLLAQPGS